MLAKLLKHDHSYEVIKNQLITIKGVSVKTAEQFLDGLINFDEFIYKKKSLRTKHEKIPI